MFTLVRTRTLRALRADLAEAEADATAARAKINEQRRNVARYTQAIDRAEGELKALRAQALLDTEDRAVLRALLRTARKQNAALDRVYVLFRRGALHSVHASLEAAEAAAEAEGAPRSGWTTHPPGAAMPPAADVLWRVQPLPLGGTADAPTV
ncbi:hypothetical protein [Streptomyces sp. DH12]|uniref:hypothetical protein n=1 Tax=Streptomyces sp. DH12 TaxID=2857010 RepID=UPI001E5CB5EF|nr:hypothetical protein [Streptomyces sp. DH12]